MPRKLMMRWCARCNKPLGKTREIYCAACKIINRRLGLANCSLDVPVWYPSRETWAAFEARIGETWVDEFCKQLELEA